MEKKNYYIRKLDSLRSLSKFENPNIKAQRESSRSQQNLKVEIYVEVNINAGGGTGTLKRLEAYWQYLLLVVILQKKDLMQRLLTGEVRVNVE